MVIITQVILKGEMYTFLDFKVFNPDKCTETAVSKQFKVETLALSKHYFYFEHPDKHITATMAQPMAEVWGRDYVLFNQWLIGIVFRETVESH